MARLIGKNLSLFAIDQTNGTTSFIANIRECSYEVEFPPQQNTALLDSVEYDEPVRERWRVSFRSAQTAHPALWGYLGTTVHFSFSTSAALGGGSKVTNLTGLLRMASHQIPDGLQETTFEITNQGASLKSALGGA